MLTRPRHRHASFAYVGLLSRSPTRDKRADAGAASLPNPYIYALSLAVY